MSTNFKELLIRNLTEEIKNAERIDVEEIALQIRNIGFSCNMCGKCCRKDYGDNTVIVSPGEIERICNYTRTEHHRIVMPLTEHETIPDRKYLEDNRDLIDTDGNIHTFGWKLSQKINGDCNFIEEKEAGNRCSIYQARPMLCSTYPFYMENGELKTSECEGLGQQISIENSRKLAGEVVSRYVAETEETIRLYKGYEGFELGPENLNKALDNIREGLINYIVHDSKGSHRTRLKINRSSIN
ncbi:YkgJ family cysteine cluster protein [Methanolobus sp. ZRKC2]|uniref:YkgJ family cysteine cluster protein n=1 Tax=Methanolobus sp. ZRKC2 TaxID=3125783 RepID=UPI0032568C21